MSDNGVKIFYTCEDLKKSIRFFSCPNGRINSPFGMFLPVLLMVVILFSLSGGASADRLPSNVPENQSFSIDTAVDATGIFEDVSRMEWVISGRNATTDGPLHYKQVIGNTVFRDLLLSNGGKISENKNFDFVSDNRGRTRYNLENEKVLTYAGVDGAHLVGEEEYLLSIAGNWNYRSEYIRCVFSGDDRVIQPAFCNVVSAKNALININSAQLSSRGRLRETGTSSIPAALNYRIAVTPDKGSGKGFAEGTVSTEFAGSIMEARDIDDYESVDPKWNKTAAENSWKDRSEVTGGIKQFQKRFVYTSGLKL